LPEGSLVVNSSQGGGSKDTWVLASRASAADRELGAAEVVRKLPPAPKTATGDRPSRNGRSGPKDVKTGEQQQQQALANGASGSQQQQQQQQQAVMD
jgi:hypothetical protein